MNTNVKGVWDAYVDFLRPVLDPASKRVAGHVVERLLGFWLMWQFYGGMDGLIASGVLARTTVYRQRAEFHAVFHVDVADFQPGISEAIKAASQAQVEASEQG